ncbi:hypothetical protein [Prochlorococcus sp. MIT 1303]|uniref:hypothetical protein n=1 Tax=Prochlorococcus sp. MIT 1303 TaxID=1723647 RepID=UPI0007B3C108|nr:hypothetical protein [Prochlorococcus sp. MIT 1303]KZR63476.1 hypothetical protein PMIT1303_01846 [Prochlorococcus sp. MIT 1303]
MTAPFLDMDTLERDVNALNNFSDLIGGYIASLDIGDDGTVFNKDEKYIGLRWSGSIGDFNLEMTPDSGYKYEDIHYKKDMFGNKYIDSGSRVQFWWPVTGRVFGQDEIVKGGFETVTPTTLDVESEANQTLSLKLHGAGDVSAPFSGDITINIETWELAMKNPDINFSTHGEGIVEALPEYMRSLLNVPIKYDEYNLKVDIGEYEFTDFDFDPDMTLFWDVFYAQYIQPFSVLWDETLGFLLGVHNPIPDFNQNVKKQIETGDKEGKKWLGNFISDQINDPSVKPYVDASVMVLLANSWNDDEYPANFVIDLPYDSRHTDITGIQSKEEHGSYAVLIEDGSGEMTNQDKSKSGRFTFYEEEKFNTGNADTITNFSQTRGDTIKLSRKKFNGLEDIDFEHVFNDMKFGRAAMSSSNIIAYNKGFEVELFYDENGKDSGLGDGGLFAVLGGQAQDLPTLVASDFVVI